MRRACDACGASYDAKRPSSRYCSDLCRKRASRNPRLTETPPEQPSRDIAGQVQARTEAKIAELELTEDPAAAVAMVLARRLDSDAETGAAVASLARQYATVMTDLDRRGKRHVDRFDELSERIRMKAQGA